MEPQSGVEAPAKRSTVNNSTGINFSLEKTEKKGQRKERGPESTLVTLPMASREYLSGFRLPRVIDDAHHTMRRASPPGRRRPAVRTLPCIGVVPPSWSHVRILPCYTLPASGQHRGACLLACSLCIEKGNRETQCPPQTQDRSLIQREKGVHY